MDAVQVASVLVSIIAATSAIASQKAAAKASTKNEETKANATVRTAEESSRITMEKEAYDRARAYDTETIKRQDAEIAEIRSDNRHLNADIKMLHSDNEQLHEDNIRLRREIKLLKAKVARLEGRTVVNPRDIETDPMMEAQRGQ